MLVEARFWLKGKRGSCTLNMSNEEPMVAMYGADGAGCRYRGGC